MRKLSKVLSVSLFTLLFLPLLISLELQKVQAGYTTAMNLPTTYENIGVPYGVAVLPDSSFWYVDWQNARIVKVDPTGKVVRTVGKLGAGEGDFSSTPVAITVDDQGFLYVLERDSCRVNKLDFNGGPVPGGIWGGCGDISIDGKLSEPRGIHYDTFSDSIYISDSGHRQVQEFTKDGEFMSRFGSEGTGDGQFAGPWSLTTDKNGKVYVVDCDNHRVEVFTTNLDHSHNFDFKFGSVDAGDAQLVFPKDIAVLDDGSIIVTSQNAHVIKKFTSTGELVLAFGSQGSGDQQFQGPQYIAKGPLPDENIYVADFVQNAIQKYTKDLTFISSFRNSGKELNKFANPASVAYDAAGNMYVLDDGAFAPRVQRFTNSGADAVTLIQPEALNNASYHMAIHKFGDQEKIFVSGHSDVRVFNLDGTPQFSFGGGGSGTGDGEFSDARGIAFDSQNRVYIGDYYNHRVQRFISDGNSVTYDTQIGGLGLGNGQFQIAEAVYVDSNDHLFVGEGPDGLSGLTPNTRIQEFDVSGSSITWLDNISSYGTADGQLLQINGLTKDSTGKLYASDGARNVVNVYGSDGGFLFSIGQYGSDNNQFTGVADIAINPLTDKLSVADGGNHRVQLFGIGLRIYGLTSNDVVRATDNYSLVKGALSPDDVGINDINSKMYYGDYVVASFSVDLSVDRTWDHVTAISLPDFSKAWLHNLKPSDPLNPENPSAPGISPSHSLYVVKQPGQTAVRVCPSANLITDLDPDSNGLPCNGATDTYILRQGDPSLEIVTIGGIDYWKINHLIGTGAMGLNTQGLNIDLSTSSIQINQPMSITVKALDVDANQDPLYHGTVTFTSTSGAAMLPANFTFTAPDNGIYTFTDQVIFTQAGDYTITVTDVSDPDLRVTSSMIHVTNPAIPTNTPAPATETPVPTDTAVPTNTPAPTATHAPGATNITNPMNTVEPTATNTPTPMPTDTPIPTATSTPIPSDISCIEDSIQDKCLVNVAISNVVLTKKGDANMEICWDTNIETKGTVRYGTAKEAVYSSATPLEEEYTITAHCATLANLADNTKFIFRIVASSPAGKTANYDGDFTMGVDALPVTGSEAVECITVDQPAFNSLNQAVFKYTTSVYGTCSIDYGNNANRAANQTASNTGVAHSSVLDLLKVDGTSDLYYQINCTIKDTDESDKQCKYNDVIPVGNYSPYLQTPETTSFFTVLTEGFSTPEKASQTLATAAVAGTATTAAIASVAYPQWLSYGLLWIKGKKKSQPWGIIYEQNSFIPIPFAVIRVIDQTGKQIKQAVSDAKGRFGFVLDIGEYSINVTKPGYTDFEKTITVSDSEQSVNLDIPLVGNGQTNMFLTLQKKFKDNLGKISLILTIIGFIFTLVSVALTFSLINLLVLVVYLVQAALMALSLPPKSWGMIQDSLSKTPIKGAFVRLFDVEEGRQVDVQIVDAKGRYGFITEKKDYLLKVDAAGYKFPGATNSATVVKTESGESFVKVDGGGNINYDFNLDPA